MLSLSENKQDRALRAATQLTPYQAPEITSPVSLQCAQYSTLIWGPRSAFGREGAKPLVFLSPAEVFRSLVWVAQGKDSVL